MKRFVFGCALPAVFAAALSASPAFAGGQDEIAKWDPRMVLGFDVVTNGVKWIGCVISR